MSAPLANPTLRVQGEDIILEDIMLDEAAIARAEEAADAILNPNRATPVPNDNLALATPITPSAIGLDRLHTVQSSKTMLSLQPQPSGNSMSQQQHRGLTPTPNGSGLGSYRIQFDFIDSPIANSRIKARDLTLSNVQQLQKEVQATNGGVKISSADRCWRWLDDALPPYDVQPSVGVCTRPPASQVKPGKGLFACFRCFG